MRDGQTERVGAIDGSTRDEPVLQHHDARPCPAGELAELKGTEARIADSPSETTGQRYGLRETDNRSSGYVRPMRTPGACRATARRLGT